MPFRTLQPGRCQPLRHSLRLACLLGALLAGTTGARAVPPPVTVPTVTPGSPAPDQAAPSAAGPESPAQGQGQGGDQSFWKRDSLLGEAGGARPWLDDHGIDISPTYAGEVMGNVSSGAGGYDGRGRGVIYDQVVNVPVNITLSKLVPGWNDAVLHVNALWIAGPGLSPSYVGDISNTSNIQAFNTVRLQELWYEQGFWNKRVSLKVGQIAADTEFFAGNTATLFLGSTFGAFNLIGANLPDPAVPNTYPLATPGVRLLVQPVPAFYAMVGVFNGTAESQTENPHGVHFPVSASSGALVFSEAGYLLNQADGDKGLQGTYKLGSFVHTRDFQTWHSQAAGVPASGGTDYGVYGIADQQVYRRDGKIVSVFVRGGGAPANVNMLDGYVDGGVNFTGFVPGRGDDVAGVAVARSMFSDSFSDAQVAGGSRPFGAETVLEATYKIQLAPWWSVQPDFQYIWTPSGQQGSPNAAVLGVRTSVTF